MNDLDFDELLAQEPRTEITLILYKNYGVCCFSRIQQAAAEKVKLGTNTSSRPSGIVLYETRWCDLGFVKINNSRLAACHN